MNFAVASGRVRLKCRCNTLFLKQQHNFYLVTIMTMPQCTEDSLDKLLKRELIPIVLTLEEQNRSLQSRMSEVNNEVVEEMRKFNETFSKLQSELSIAKRVND